MARTLGVVVAGGRGERLGLDMPKAFVTLAGASLIERAVLRAGLHADELVVVAPAGMALPEVDARRVDDLPGAEGPMAGALAGLEAIPCERALVLGVDFPFLSDAVVVALLDRVSRGAPGAMPELEGRLQPLVSAWSSDGILRLRERFDAGERSLAAAGEAIGVSRLGAPELERLPGGVDALFNLNTAPDLERARRFFEARARERRG